MRQKEHKTVTSEDHQKSAWCVGRELPFNAVDAMHDGGRLTLRTCATPTDVVVAVSDTGTGMDGATRQRCLEPFYTAKEARGTGLGLAIVYGVTERHTTQLSIESAVGRGTTVRLLFPRALSQGALDVQPAQVEASTHSLRILVVDDDPLVRQLRQDVLQCEGHVVTVAAGGGVGLAALREARERQEPFDVVTDLGMPEMDGCKMVLGAKQEAPDTPVILTILHKETVRLSHFIKEFLDLQRMQAGHQVYHLTPTNVVAVLRDAVSVFALESGSHVIRLEVPEARPDVHADAERLCQVLANLLSNAIKCSPHGGEVTVGQARKERRRWSGEQTMGWVSLLRLCPSYSACFTGSSTMRPATSEAQAWALPWSRRLWKGTTGRSGWRASWARAVPFFLPYPLHFLRPMSPPGTACPVLWPRHLGQKRSSRRDRRASTMRFLVALADLFRYRTCKKSKGQSLFFLVYNGNSEMLPALGADELRDLPE